MSECSLGNTPLPGIDIRGEPWESQAAHAGGEVEQVGREGTHITGEAAEEVVEGDIEVGDVLRSPRRELCGVGRPGKRANGGSEDCTVQPSLGTHSGASARKAKFRRRLLRPLGAGSVEGDS